MSAKILVKDYDDSVVEAKIEKDPMFLGGWKVSYGNTIRAIGVTEVVDDFGFEEYKKKKNKMKEQIEFSEFLEIEKKLEVKFGTVTEVEKMEKSDKMLKLQVDFGDETRTVMTNIGNRENLPTLLVGFQFPFITNLKPAKMMGVVSEAMIMIPEYKDVLEFSSTRFKNGSKLL